MQSVTTENHEDLASHRNPVEINQHDKFFTRIMSKDTSVFNSSCPVYYGGASGSVPFMWESRPGTPKHTLFSDTSDVPPLTPPPSYFSSKSMHKNMKPNYNLLSGIFPRLTNLRKKNHVTPSSSMSSTTTTTSSIYSSSSSSSSSLSSFYSPPVNSKVQRRRFLPCSTPPHFSFDEDGDNSNDDEKNLRRRMSLHSTMCYNFFKRKAVRGRHLMNNMKSKFLSMAGHGSS